MMGFFPWKRVLRKKKAWLSLAVMLIFGLVAGLASWLAPHDPYKFHVTQRYLPPAWVQDVTPPGEREYLLGTDWVGRDILSRLLYGARTAFLLALMAVPLAALFGTLVGLTSGYAGGWVDAALTLVIDMVNALPGIMFMVVIVLILRERWSPSWFNGLVTLVIGYAAVSWVSLARLIRINVLQIKAQLFVESAVALGASPRWIILRHLLPNVLHVILVWVINNIPAIILIEAVLGYIGVGVTGAGEGAEFTVVSWGGMFFSGRSMLSTKGLMLVIPSVCILLISMSFILLGDFLNEVIRQGQE